LTTQSAAAIVALADRGLPALPPLGIVLGSGLGGLADEAEEAIAIPYAEIPGFPAPSVAGHSGRLVVGKLAGKPVALFQGRGHYYERGDAREMFTAIETFHRLGGRSLFLTNAAGGLHKDWPPPALAAITDHINLAGANPLIGLPTDKRFVPMDGAYDPALLATLRKAAAAAAIALREGVYAWFSGPSFETPAEIRAAKVLGADMVGMSTAPEALIARYFGLRVAAVSVITNFAAGLPGSDLSHEQTQKVAALGARQFGALIKAFIAAHEDAP